MKYAKRICSALLVLSMLIFSFSTPAYSASNVCEIFYFNEYGVGPGGTLTIQASLYNTGYTVRRYADLPVGSVIDTLNDDKVFVIVSHGEPGRVNCGDGTSLTDKPPHDGSSYNSLRSWFAQNDLRDVLFAYYGSCESAVTDPACGNLLTSTTGYFGAKSAIGFYDEVYHDYATYYEIQLFSLLRQGYTVGAADTLAKTYTYSEYGDYGEVDSSVVSGNSSQKIKSENKSTTLDLTKAGATDIAAIQGLFGNENNSLSTVSASHHEAVIGTALDAFQDSNYLYLLDEETHLPNTIALIDDTNCPILGSVNSTKSAIEIVEKFAHTAIPNLFGGNEFEAFCAVYDETEDKTYSVELWEKLEDNFYTGNKVAAILSSKGVLESLVVRENGYQNQIQSAMDLPSSTDANISQEIAVDIAYSAIATTAEQLEMVENVGTQQTEEDVSSPCTPLNSAGDGTLDIELYDIMVEDSQDQKVRTYKEIINNNPCWIVEISDVPTNCFWSVGFIVTIDAQSGSVIAISHTR